MIFTRLLPRFTHSGGDMGKDLNGNELGKGIRQRSDGLYEVRYTDKDGRRRSKYTKALDKPVQTLNDWFDTWLAVYHPNCKPVTIARYKALYNHVRDTIGRRDISGLTPFDMQKAINEIPYQTTTNQLSTMLSNSMAEAQSQGLIQTNPANHIIVGKRHKAKHNRALTESEIQRLYSATEKSSYLHSILVLGLHTGMRISEILGLQWTDISFERKRIHVTGTLAYIDGQFVRTDPKSLSSDRYIPIDDEVQNELTRQRIRKKRIAAKYKSLEGMDDLIFVTRQNKPIYRSSVNHALNTLCDKLDIPRITTHTMRHTFATNCIKNGMNPKIVQMVLGHKSIQTTMDTYCNLTYDDIVEAMNGVKWGKKEWSDTI